MNKDSYYVFKYNDVSEHGTAMYGFFTCTGGQYKKLLKKIDRNIDEDGVTYWTLGCGASMPLYKSSDDFDNVVSHREITVEQYEEIVKVFGKRYGITGPFDGLM